MWRWCRQVRGRLLGGRDRHAVICVRGPPPPRSRPSARPLAKFRAPPGAAPAAGGRGIPRRAAQNAEHGFAKRWQRPLLAESGHRAYKTIREGRKGVRFGQGADSGRSCRSVLGTRRVLRLFCVFGPGCMGRVAHQRPGPWPGAWPRPFRLVARPRRLAQIRRQAGGFDLTHVTPITYLSGILHQCA